ncbi:O-antigen ligase family protein [Flagellimonas sp.]|uniref:O-antigen ligase family protein n=1 Tax=Flagellimonas sp. TaxID=2058762 RepID=UPI003B523E56
MKIIALILLFLVIPSLNDESLQQSTLITKTIFHVYGLLIIIGLSTMIFLFKQGKMAIFEVSWIDIALLILFLFIVSNRYIVQNNYSFSIRFIDFLSLLILYLILRALKGRSIIFLAMAIIMSGAVQAIYGNLQLLNYFPSLHSRFAISGSYFNPGPYAGFLATCWTPSFGMYLFKDKVTSFFQSRRVWENSKMVFFISLLIKYVPLIGLVSIAVVLPSTKSRAAWIAVIVGSTLLLLIKYKVLEWFKSLTGERKITILVVTTALVIGGALQLYNFKKVSADGRILIWKVSGNLIKTNPIFGVGFDRTNAHYMDIQAKYFSNNQHDKEHELADNTYYIFNEPLLILIENGLIGFVLTIVVSFLIFKVKVLEKEKILKLICIATLLTIFIFGLFSYPSQILSIKMIAVWATSSLATMDKKKIVFNINYPPNWGKTCKQLSRLVAVSFILLMLKGTYIYIKKVESEFRNWQLAINAYNYGSYTTSLIKFKSVSTVLGRDGQVLMNYGKALVMAGKNNKAIVVLNQAKHYLNNTIIEMALGDAHKTIKNYKRAERAYQQAADMVPNRFYPDYLLVKLYEESGQSQKAVEKAQLVLQKEVKVPSIAIEEIKTEMIQVLKQYSNTTN